MFVLHSAWQKLFVEPIATSSVMLLGYIVPNPAAVQSSSAKEDGSTHVSTPEPSVSNTSPGSPSLSGNVNSKVVPIASGALSLTLLVPLASNSLNLRPPVSPLFVP